MDTVVFADSQTIRVFSTEMVLTKINAEVDTAAARSFAISGYPTLVMVDKDGQEIDRISGYLPTKEFLKTIDDYSKGIGTLADLLNKAKEKPERQLSYDIADKYKYRGKPVEATEWYQKVIAVAPTDSLAFESRMALADMLRRGKKWDETVVAFEAIAKDFEGKPSMVGQSRMALANVYVRQKEWDKALTIYKGIAIDFKGMDFAPDAEFYIGYTLGKKGDTASAISAYEQFLKNNPTSPDTTDVRERIEKLKSPPPVEKTK